MTEDFSAMFWTSIPAFWAQLSYYKCWNQETQWIVSIIWCRTCPCNHYTLTIKNLQVSWRWYNDNCSHPIINEWKIDGSLPMGHQTVTSRTRSPILLQRRKRSHWQVWGIFYKMFQMMRLSKRCTETSQRHGRKLTKNLFYLVLECF